MSTACVSRQLDAVRQPRDAQSTRLVKFWRFGNVDGRFSNSFGGYPTRVYTLARCGCRALDSSSRWLTADSVDQCPPSTVAVAVLWSFPSLPSNRPGRSGPTAYHPTSLVFRKGWSARCRGPVCGYTSSVHPIYLNFISRFLVCLNQISRYGQTCTLQFVFVYTVSLCISYTYIYI